VLYRFKGGSDGARAYAGVTLLRGHIYGTTTEGGSGCGTTGCGLIFELTAHNKERVLYRFTGGDDGEFPNGLTAVGDTLYGTTEAGGTKGSGTFFSITPGGKFTLIYTFLDIPDAAGPGANVIYLKNKGEFYGTAIGGGTAGQGAVFEVSIAGKESVLYSFKGNTDGSDPQGPLFALSGDLYGTTHSGGNGGCTDDQGCGTVFKVKQ
jgi:uncharacterized repeat protein (TIGR03803 family)